MSVENGDEVEIALHYDTDLSGVYADPAGWIPVTVRIDDCYICGSGEPSDGTVGEGGYVLSELLDSVRSVEKGDSANVEFSYHPFWIVLRSIDEDTMAIHGSSTYGGIEHPNKRLEINRSTELSKEAWREEVVETTKEFIEKVSRSNPALKNHELVERLSDKVGNF